MMGRAAAGLVVALGLACLPGRDVSATLATAGEIAFREVAWPFLMDQWGRGRALRCDGPPCAGGADLYIRSKVGFCECFNHVDADDVDRLTDFDLLGGDDVVPLGSDRAIRLDGNPARLHGFLLRGRGGPPRLVLVAVVARDCEAQVVTLVAPPAASVRLEAAVIDVMLRAAPGPSRRTGEAR